MKQTYSVSGMMCSSCAAHIEHAVRAIDEVTDVSVNLLTNSMIVEGEVSKEAVIRAVQAAGYAVTPKETSEKALLLPRHTVNRSVLLISLALSALLLYVDMGQMFLPYPAFLDKQLHPITFSILQIALAVPVVGLHYRYYIGGVSSLLCGKPNMDSLIALGSGVAMLYSFGLFLEICLHPESDAASELAFCSGAMIPTLVSLGKTLEGNAKDKTADAIRALVSLTPQTVTVLRDAEKKHVSIEELQMNDTLILTVGDKIPCDGKITDGHVSIDESAITGESMPKEKGIGEPLFAGCLVTDGYALVQPQKIGQETSLSQIIRLVSESSATKAPIARLADTVSYYFVPGVLLASLITFLTWMFIGVPFSEAMDRAISVLVISCPCALGLATPTAMMCAIGKGAQLGIHIKNSAALETVGNIKQIAFDKTGTVTTGKMQVLSYRVASSVEKEHLFSVAHAMEATSEHPIARAIYAFTEETENIEIQKASTLPGKGIIVKTNDGNYAMGNATLMSDFEIDTSFWKEMQDEADEIGVGIVFVCNEEKILGAFSVCDMPKEDAKDAISQLKALGIHPCMITGDTQSVAAHIGRVVGIEEVQSDLTPTDKRRTIQTLSQRKKTAMVGDGINDALPLVQADVGIAMGAGSGVAIESCDIVLRNNRLTDVVSLVRLGRFTLQKVRQNLFWALIYNSICIPLAAGVLVPVGFSLSPMISAAAMALSSLTVVGNALLIKRFHS